MSKGTRFRREKSIRNWSEYNAGLKQRYDVTIWIDEELFASAPESTGKRGRPAVYHDALIEAILTLRCLYHLPLRGAEGMARSLFPLLGLNADAVPDYTTLSRRSATLDIVVPATIPGHRIHMVVDSTGLKVYGEGEWKVRQHGYSKRRTWRKLHVGVDEYTGQIIADDLTENSVGDQEHLPALLEQADSKGVRLRQVSADGIYDTRDCYDAVNSRGARFVSPPRKNAALPPTNAPPHPRHQAIRDCQNMGRKRWKKESGYHRRSLSETAMFRFKTSFGARLMARGFPQQKRETRIKVKILNQFNIIAWPKYA